MCDVKVMISTQNSKYGEALVLETTPRSGKYLLGFRVDPTEKLKPLAMKLRQLWKVAQTDVINGVKMELCQDDKVRFKRTVFDTRRMRKKFIRQGGK